MAYHIGTCGFQYPDWYGPFYPPALSKNAALSAYADCFDALELDVTYYRTPSVASAQRLASILQNRVLLAVKAPGALTHGRRLDSETLDPFFQFLEPLRNGNTLRCLLLQFPESFKATRWNLSFLAQVTQAMPPDQLVLEFRSGTWDSGPLREEARSLCQAIAEVDQPSLAGLSASGLVEGLGMSDLRYLRFHGRNSENWHDGTASSRYDYLYQREELEPIAKGLRATDRKETTTLIFFNNHARAQATENAMMLSEILGIPRSHPRAIERDLFS